MCEHVLEVTEKILQEASNNRPVFSRSLSQRVSPVVNGGVFISGCPKLGIHCNTYMYVELDQLLCLTVIPSFPQGVSEEVEESQLKTFLEHISAKFVQSNPSVRDRLLQIIPFLTFGDVDNMNTLLDYFSPHLNFDQ